jgi:hypothetical protein
MPKRIEAPGLYKTGLSSPLLLNVLVTAPPGGFGADKDIAKDLTDYFKNDGARAGDDMVKVALTFGLKAVHAFFRGMMYGVPAPGKKKDNHASAGTLRAYCQLLAAYTRYVELKHLPTSALRQWACPKTPTNRRGYLLVPTWVHCLDGTTAAKFDSVAIVDFFKSVYDGELHDIKPTHSTYKTFKAACLGLMNYDCNEKKLDPLPDGLFTATAALKQVPQWQKLLEHESNRKNVFDQVTGECAIDLHAGIKASIWDHAQRAHAEMVAMDTGQVNFNSERTKLQTRAIWRMSCVSGLRISDAAAVYLHHFFTRRVEHYGPDGAAVMNFITHNGKTNFGRNLQWSGMFQHRNSRLCAIVAGGEVLVHQLCVEKDKFPDFSNPNLAVLQPSYPLTITTSAQRHRLRDPFDAYTLRSSMLSESDAAAHRLSPCTSLRRACVAEPRKGLVAGVGGKRAASTRSISAICRQIGLHTPRGAERTCGYLISACRP